MCGIAIQSNPANMCVNCLRSQVDITEGIPKQIILHQCRGCQRYLRPPWVSCDLESKELLAICLKKITGLNKVKLIDAGFIWTEPHSRRIKVKLTIQKDVLNGVKLQQVFAVEFLIQNQQCDTCQRSYTDHTWRAQVQVRQKVDHKKTFYLLEQLILKHNAHEKCINVEQVPTGIDFSFGERSHALKFLDFVSSVVPTRQKAAKQLISEDIHLALQNFKFTYALEIVPLCKDDLVVLPVKTAGQCGNINPVSLCLRVAANVYLMDPRSLQLTELSAEKYWREPFRALMASSQLEEFTVLDVTPVTIAPLTGAALRRKQANTRVKGRRGSSSSSRGSTRDRDEEMGSVGFSSGSSVRSGMAGSKRRNGDGDDDDERASVAASSGIVGGGFGGGFTGAVSLAGGSVQFNGAMSVASTVTGGFKGKMLLADAEVMRTRDLGVSDTRFIVRTHLGNILRPGDAVMGYDLTNAVYNEADAESSALGSKGKAGKGSSSGGGGGKGMKVDLPDVVLVRKVHPKHRVRIDDEASTPAPAASNAAASAPAAAGGDADMDGAAAASGVGGGKAKQRVWKLKRLDDVMGPGAVKHSDVIRKGDEERAARDYEAFMQELETDPSLRKGVNMYKDQQAIEARRAAANARLEAVSAGKKETKVSFATASSSSDSAAAVAAAAGSKPKKASAASAASGRGGDDGEDDDEYDGEDDDGDIGLEELLDDLTLHGGAGGAGAEVDPDDEIALRASAAASAAAGGASASAGAGWGGTEAGPDHQDAPALGPVEDDEEGLALTAAGRKHLGKVQEGDAEDEEDDDDREL